MSAIHFLHTDPVKAKLKFPKPPKEKIKENITLNYQLINFLTQDVIPSVQQLQDDKILPKKNLYNHLLKLSDDDCGNMFKIYTEAGRKYEYAKDYDFITDYFQRLAGKLFSAYQKHTDKYLIDLMYVILCYEFITTSAPTIAIANHQSPNYKGLKLIQEELDAVKIVFNERFSKVSNQKFIHGKYKSLFDKIKKCTHNEFIQLTENI